MSYDKNKYKALVKDTIIFSIGSIGSKIILFFLVPFYTAYLSAEDYGISNLVFTVGQFMIPILSLEIFDAVLRFGLSKTVTKENVLFNAFIVIVIDVVACFLLYPVLGMYKPIRPWRIYLLIYFIFSILNSSLMNYLKVCDKNKSYAFISLLQTLALCGFNIVFIACLKYGIRGYLLSYILALLISSTAAFISGRIYSSLIKGTFKADLMKEMLVYSVPLVLNSISWWLISSSDKIMIERMVGATELGVYTVAAKIPALINVIIAIFQQAWGISSIKEIESTNDIKFFSNTFRYYRVIVFTACFAVLSVSNTFMRIYVGNGQEFLTASNYVPLLLVSAVFSAISTFYGSLYTALRKTNRIMTTTLVSGVANIIVNYIAIHHLGTMGAVVGTVVAYVLTTIFRIIDMKKFIKMDIDYKRFLANFILIFAFALFATNSVNDNVLVSVLFIAGMICVNYKDYLDLIHRR